MTAATPGWQAHRRWLQTRWPDMTEQAIAKDWEVLSSQAKAAWAAAAGPQPAPDVELTQMHLTLPDTGQAAPDLANDEPFSVRDRLNARDRARYDWAADQLGPSGELPLADVAEGIWRTAAQQPQPVPELAAAVTGAALQKAVDARRDLDGARAAAASIMNLVPLGRHASPDECEQIRRELRAIVTGLPS